MRSPPPARPARRAGGRRETHPRTGNKTGVARADNARVAAHARRAVVRDRAAAADRGIVCVWFNTGRPTVLAASPTRLQVREKNRAVRGERASSTFRRVRAHSTRGDGSVEIEIDQSIDQGPDHSNRGGDGSIDLEIDQSIEVRINRGVGSIDRSKGSRPPPADGVRRRRLRAVVLLAVLRQLAVARVVACGGRRRHIGSPAAHVPNRPSSPKGGLQARQQPARVTGRRASPPSRSRG